MAQVAQTAAEYFDRYESALKTNSLVQGAWNSEQDGRHVACALGVLGDSVDSSSQCPATVMPRWLAQMVPAFFDRQKQDQAFAWGLEFAAELKRIDGKVPFSVVHDWHANVVCPLGIEAAEKRGRDTAPHLALQALHLRALAGDVPTETEWRPVLRNANANADANANANAYANADAYAYADANADAYAYANADAYAYADANADAYAYADANAYANANAYAYADADAYAYACAYAYADADANAYACAYAYACADAWNRLATGMIECLRRVQE
jgi:hypothetical protein